MLLTLLNNLILLHRCPILLLYVSDHPWVIEYVDLLILFLISRYINRVLVVMLYELINKIDMRMLRLKLCLFLISSLMLLITPVKRIDDMSQIIELYWICLEDIKIFVCIVFQIILITINLSLLLTKDSILLQVLVFES